MNATTSADLPISKELLDILRCPQAVQQKNKYGTDPGRLELVHNTWLVSNDSGLKYPIRDGIPIMLIDEGMKWKDVAATDLPVPPPTDQPAAPSGNSNNAVSNQSSGPNVKLIAALAAVVLAILFLRRKA